MSSPDLTKFQQRLAERRAREEAAAAAKKAETEVTTEFDEDLIPEVPYERDENALEIDNVLDRIDIIDAYRRWCGKMVPVVRGDQREGIKISCPIPGHVDSDPSAWINLDKQTWFCGGCQEGGDKFDIAAYWLGFPVPDYKDGVNFHKLRERMAEDFGYTRHEHHDGSATYTAPIIVEDKEEAPVPPPEPPSAEVTSIYDDSEEEIVMPHLDWKPIAPKDTFLDAYMKAVCVDDAPEEYHFFHALIALGFALGRDVTLFDSVPIYGNLFVCTLGRSGIGKSKARSHLQGLLERALPHDWSNPNSKGVRKVASPGSAEHLIRQFCKPVEDPSSPKTIAYYAPVRGLIDFNELSSLVGRTNRTGSVMKPTMMEFYDMERVVETGSMTHGSTKAENPFASALTTTQPKALKTLLTGADDSSGFLNRWVFVPGTEKKRFSVGGVQVDIEPAVKPLEDIMAWASTFGADKVEWSVEALQRFDEFFQGTIEPDKRKSDNDLIVRIDLTLKKMMLLFAANRKERTLSEQSVLDAIYCYPYLKAAYGIPEGQIGNTLTNEISDAIMYRIKKVMEDGRKEGVTLREINVGLRRRKYPPKMLNDVLEALVKLELVEVNTTQTGKVGRPTKRYTVA